MSNWANPEREFFLEESTKGAVIWEPNWNKNRTANVADNEIIVPLFLLKNKERLSAPLFLIKLSWISVWV
ncbi:hypothetical protein [Mycoplasma parvum]|uniref:Uncharacterized protein n=1 Tax=Mycoplasma parvum str. Indiana TaxID=1403316 RepID=U5NCM6_9MOLU|nr:hypothetical protein [Mycoplasma parvum]AGX89080.1 hypothetical protein PRV_01625 [Mycoplasma parvum str. Indiana]